MSNKLHYNPNKLPQKPVLPIVDACSAKSFDCNAIYSDFEFIGKGTNPSIETVYNTKLCGIALKIEHSWENYESMAYTIPLALRQYENYVITRNNIDSNIPEPFYDLVGERPNFYYFLPKYSKTLSIIAPLDAPIDNSLLLNQDEINFLSSLHFHIPENPNPEHLLTNEQNEQKTEIIKKIRQYTDSISIANSILKKLISDSNAIPPSESLQIDKIDI